MFIVDYHLLSLSEIWRLMDFFITTNLNSRNGYLELKDKHHKANCDEQNASIWLHLQHIMGLGKTTLNKLTPKYALDHTGTVHNCFSKLVNYACTNWLGGFYRSRVFTRGNTRDIFLNVNVNKKRQTACSQMPGVYLRANTRDR